LLCVAAATLLKRHVWRDNLHVFWDLKVYVGTMEARMQGLDPYAPATLGVFGIPSDYLVTTPPGVTWLLGLLGAPLLRDHAGVLLGAAHLLALAATTSLLARIFFGHGLTEIALACAAYLGMFAGVGIVSLGAANLGTLQHAIIIAALVPGLFHGRWGMALAAIFVASLFKPFYLAYLLFPVAAHGWSWRMLGVGALVSLATCGAYLAQAWLAPEAFQGWLANVHATLILQGDIGLNLLGARMLVGTGWVPYAVQATAIGVMVAFAVLGSTTGRRRWAVLLVVVLFANPRILSYDLAVAAVPFAFVYACLLGRFSPLAMEPLARIALSVGGLALLQVSSYYPTGIDPHLAFPLTALLGVAAVSWPWASPAARPGLGDAGDGPATSPLRISEIAPPM
jgi:hypothetical protein